MVPLLCTCLREVRPKFRPPEFWRPFSLSLFGAQKTWQLGEVRGDPPRLVSAEHLGGRAPGRAFLASKAHLPISIKPSRNIHPEHAQYESSREYVQVV